MSVLAKLTAKCGPDSTIPQTMAMDALFAGKNETANQIDRLSVIDSNRVIDR